MKIERCSNGHYYDASIHAACPYCKETPVAPKENVDAAGEHTSLQQASAEVLPTQPKPQFAEPLPTELNQELVLPQQPEPVVGWLVCIDGPGKGKDIRICAGMNTIGRSRGQDICLEDDPYIALEKHARLSFSAETCSFMLFPGDGHSLVILNGDELTAPKPLRKLDRITLGASLLLFVPLCGDGFDWVTGVK